jgi:hypothetical protein
MMVIPWRGWARRPLTPRGKYGPEIVDESMAMRVPEPGAVCTHFKRERIDQRLGESWPKIALQFLNQSAVGNVFGGGNEGVKKGDPRGRFRWKNTMRRIDSYIQKYGPVAGPMFYRTLQNRAAYAGVSARLRKKIAWLKSAPAQVSGEAVPKPLESQGTLLDAPK